MSGKKTSKIGRVRAILAGFLVLIGIFTGVSGTILSNDVVYAVGENSETSTEETSNADTETKNDKEEKKEDNQKDSATTTAGDNCKKSLGALGWVVCPSTGKIAEAVDWLYNKIEEFLVVSPVSAEDGSPIYEIWKYCRGLTNIVFIIFLLIVIYSQITGLGISNYGIKKTLPKLIVTAVLVNLSFLICSLAVDASNIIGNSLRGVFTSVEEATLATGASELGPVSVSSVYTTLASGGTLAIGATAIAFDLGMIWMLIPVALGAIVAVVTGLITISLRQAVVVLLIMVSPLAMVAYILPNTEQWFKKWKDLLTKMLVFYPMFSLLFGASSLAGFALIMSAKDGIGLLLGIAVQIFPLFFAWKLMQMSGTFLGGINAKIRGIAAKPLATNRAWAESHRDNRKAARLAKDNVYAPNTRLMQFMNNRKVMREADTTEYLKHAEKRGLAYRAGQNWKGAGANGKPTRKGMSVYTRQAQGLEYNKIIERDKNTMNKGLGYLAKEGTIEHARLDKLDAQMVSAADTFKMEQARGEKIEYENAMGFHKRMEDAMNAHMDMENGFTRDKDGKIIGRRDGYKFHMDPSKLEKSAELARYNAAYQIMEGNVEDVQYAAATAAYAYDTQLKSYGTKMQKYFEMAPPTKDVVYRLNELTTKSGVDQNIDAIISGMRTLNQRGDTDLVKEQLDNLAVVSEEEGRKGIVLGSHASQALASFLMFEVKDNDPWLRRFGKYINLETAHIYNKNERKKMTVDYDEYVKGYYYNPGDPHDKEHRQYSKKDMQVLMEGTSLDNMERTAVDTYLKSVMDAYSDENGVILDEDYEEFEEKRKAIDLATAPQFISSMRKTLSGSEQINSLVKDLTGYEKKQNAENGKYELKSVFEDEKIQKRFGKNLDRYKEYNDWWAQKYLRSLVPSQVLSMRSDELVAFERLLPEWHRKKYPGLHDKMKAQLAAKHKELDDAEIENIVTATEKRAMFRESFDLGVLEQISRTNARRGVLDAKPILRELMGLDGDDGTNRIGLSKYIANKKKFEESMKGIDDKEKISKTEEEEIEQIMRELETIYEQRKNANSSGSTSGQVAPSNLFSEVEVNEFRRKCSEIFRNLEEGGDARAFYESTYDYVEKHAPIIANAYAKYYEDHEFASLIDLYNELDILLDSLLS